MLKVGVLDVGFKTSTPEGDAQSCQIPPDCGSPCVPGCTSLEQFLSG